MKNNNFTMAEIAVGVLFNRKTEEIKKTLSDSRLLAEEVLTGKVSFQGETNDEKFSLNQEEIQRLRKKGPHTIFVPKAATSIDGLLKEIEWEGQLSIIMTGIVSSFVEVALYAGTFSKNGSLLIQGEVGSEYDFDSAFVGTTCPILGIWDGDFPADAFAGSTIEKIVSTESSHSNLPIEKCAVQWAGAFHENLSRGFCGKSSRNHLVVAALNAKTIENCFNGTGAKKVSLIAPVLEELIGTNFIGELEMEDLFIYAPNLTSAELSFSLVPKLKTISFEFSEEMKLLDCEIEEIPMVQAHHIMGELGNIHGQSEHFRLSWTPISSESTSVFDFTPLGEIKSKEVYFQITLGIGLTEVILPKFGDTVESVTIEKGVFTSLIVGNVTFTGELPVGCKFEIV